MSCSPSAHAIARDDCSNWTRCRLYRELWYPSPLSGPSLERTLVGRPHSTAAAVATGHQRFLPSERCSPCCRPRARRLCVLRRVVHNGNKPCCVVTLMIATASSSSLPISVRHRRSWSVGCGERDSNGSPFGASQRHTLLGSGTGVCMHLYARVFVCMYARMYVYY